MPSQNFCQIPLLHQLTSSQDPKVSRYHAKFFILPNKYRIEDIGSTNGTYVNGQKISNTLLKTNDMVKVGETKIDLGLDRNQAFVRVAYPSFDHIAPKRPPNIPEKNPIIIVILLSQFLFIFLICRPKLFIIATKITAIAIICVIVFNFISNISLAPINKPITKLKNIGKNL